MTQINNVEFYTNTVQPFLDKIIEFDKQDEKVGDIFGDNKELTDIYSHYLDDKDGGDKSIEGIMLFSGIMAKSRDNNGKEHYDLKTVNGQDISQNLLSMFFNPSLGKNSAGTQEIRRNKAASNSTSYAPELQNYMGDATKQTVEASQLNQFLKGNLSGKGQLLIDLCTKPMKGKKGQDLPPIDPALVASIMAHETGNGTSNAVKNKNNVGGMMGSGGLKAYDSIDSGIYDMVRNLRENYIAKGKDTIAEIGAKYCPVGAANDPNGLNKNWVGAVAANLQKIRYTNTNITS